MKKIIVLLFCICVAGTTQAQKAPYNVVFDVTSPDTLVHQMVMRWVSEVRAADPNSNVEVVFFGKSLAMVTSGKSTVSDKIAALASPNVRFSVCEVAMKSNGVEKSELLPQVTTVPDGIYRVIQRQYEGWGYIKGTR